MLFIASRTKSHTNSTKAIKTVKKLQQLSNPPQKPLQTCKIGKNLQTRKKRQKPQNHEQNYKSTPKMTQNFDPFQPTHLKMVYNAMYRFKNMLFGPEISVAFTKRYENMISTHSLYTPLLHRNFYQYQDAPNDYT